MGFFTAQKRLEAFGFGGTGVGLNATQSQQLSRTFSKVCELQEEMEEVRAKAATDQVSTSLTPQNVSDITTNIPSASVSFDSNSNEYEIEIAGNTVSLVNVDIARGSIFLVNNKITLSLKFNNEDTTLPNFSLSLIGDNLSVSSSARDVSLTENISTHVFNFENDRSKVGEAFISIRLSYNDGQDAIIQPSFRISEITFESDQSLINSIEEDILTETGKNASSKEVRLQNAKIGQNI